MKYVVLILVGLFSLVAVRPSNAAAECPPETGVALQVLGSGGPIADDGRASSSYLIWVDGKSRVLIDAGGGSFLRVGDTVVVFGGDQNGRGMRFADFAADADLLLMHMPIPDGASGAARKLHAPPDVIAKIARRARAKMLVLSHFMARSLADLDDNVGIVRDGYLGPIVVAEDLLCQIVLSN